jgi:hypothetical protein
MNVPYPMIETVLRLTYTCNMHEYIDLLSTSFALEYSLRKLQPLRTQMTV